MAKIASKVILIEAEPELTATAILKERAFAHPKLEILRGVRVRSITGDDKVEALELEDSEGKRKIKMKVEGVLVHIGLEANTTYLDGIIPLDSQGQIIVNDKMETRVPYIFAAGDVRSDSPRQVVTAVGDGATAAH